MQLLTQTGLEFHIAHRLVHAGQPLVALLDADAERHVPRPQPRVAKALHKMLRAAQPATQEPEQLVACGGQVRRVHTTQDGVGGLQLHQVIEPLYQRANARLTADEFKRDSGFGFVVCHDYL